MSTLDTRIRAEVDRMMRLGEMGDADAELRGLRLAARSGDIEALIELARRKGVAVPEMIRIPAGKDLLGSPPEEEGRWDNEEQLEVTFDKDYWMGSAPVTQTEYEAVMGRNPAHFKDGHDAPDRPVESVSWYDAVKYCNKLSELCGLPPSYIGDRKKGYLWREGPGFRLPTEVEWEYAARAGCDEARYGELDDIAWYDGNSEGTTHPVRQLKPNDWGLFDTLGNVWEWCWDEYKQKMEVAAPDIALSDKTWHGSSEGPNEPQQKEEEPCHVDRSIHESSANVEAAERSSHTDSPRQTESSTSTRSVSSVTPESDQSAARDVSPMTRAIENASGSSSESGSQPRRDNGTSTASGTIHAFERATESTISPRRERPEQHEHNERPSSADPRAHDRLSSEHSQTDSLSDHRSVSTASSQREQQSTDDRSLRPTTTADTTESTGSTSSGSASPATTRSTMQDENERPFDLYEEPHTTLEDIPHDSHHGTGVGYVDRTASASDSPGDDIPFDAGTPPPPGASPGTSAQPLSATATGSEQATPASEPADDASVSSSVSDSSGGDAPFETCGEPDGQTPRVPSRPHESATSEEASRLQASATASVGNDDPFVCETDEVDTSSGATAAPVMRGDHARQDSDHVDTDSDSSGDAHPFVSDAEASSVRTAQASSDATSAGAVGGTVGRVSESLGDDVPFGGSEDSASMLEDGRTSPSPVENTSRRLRASSGSVSSADRDPFDDPEDVPSFSETRAIDEAADTIPAGGAAQASASDSSEADVPFEASEGTASRSGEPHTHASVDASGTGSCSADPAEAHTDFDSAETEDPFPRTRHEEDRSTQGSSSTASGSLAHTTSWDSGSSGGRDPFVDSTIPADTCSSEDSAMCGEERDSDTTRRIGAAFDPSEADVPFEDTHRETSASPEEEAAASDVVHHTATSGVVSLDGTHLFHAQGSAAGASASDSSVGEGPFDAPGSSSATLCSAGGPGDHTCHPPEQASSAGSPGRSIPAPQNEASPSPESSGDSGSSEADVPFVHDAPAGETAGTSRLPSRRAAGTASLGSLATDGSGTAFDLPEVDLPFETRPCEDSRTATPSTVSGVPIDPTPSGGPLTAQSAGATASASQGGEHPFEPLERREPSTVGRDSTSEVEPNQTSTNTSSAASSSASDSPGDDHPFHQGGTSPSSSGEDRQPTSSTGAEHPTVEAICSASVSARPSTPGYALPDGDADPFGSFVAGTHSASHTALITTGERSPQASDRLPDESTQARLADLDSALPGDERPFGPTAQATEDRSGTGSASQGASSATSRTDSRSSASTQETSSGSGSCEDDTDPTSASVGSARRTPTTDTTTGGHRAETDGSGEHTVSIRVSELSGADLPFPSTQPEASTTTSPEQSSRATPTTPTPHACTSTVERTSVPAGQAAPTRETASGSSDPREVYDPFPPASRTTSQTPGPFEVPADSMSQQPAARPAGAQEYWPPVERRHAGSDSRGGDFRPFSGERESCEDVRSQLTSTEAHQATTSASTSPGSRPTVSGSSTWASDSSEGDVPFCDTSARSTDPHECSPCREATSPSQAETSTGRQESHVPSAADYSVSVSRGQETRTDTFDLQLGLQSWDSASTRARGPASQTEDARSTTSTSGDSDSPEADLPFGRSGRTPHSSTAAATDGTEQQSHGSRSGLPAHRQSQTSASASSWDDTPFASAVPEDRHGGSQPDTAGSHDGQTGVRRGVAYGSPGGDIPFGGTEAETLAAVRAVDMEDEPSHHLSDTREASVSPGDSRPFPRAVLSEDPDGSSHERSAPTHQQSSSDAQSERAIHDSAATSPTSSDSIETDPATLSWAFGSPEGDIPFGAPSSEGSTSSPPASWSSHSPPVAIDSSGSPSGAFGSPEVDVPFGGGRSEACSAEPSRFTDETTTGPVSAVAISADRSASASAGLIQTVEIPVPFLEGRSGPTTPPQGDSSPSPEVESGPASPSSSRAETASPSSETTRPSDSASPGSDLPFVVRTPGGQSSTFEDQASTGYATTPSSGVDTSRTLPTRQAASTSSASESQEDRHPFDVVVSGGSRPHEERPSERGSRIRTRTSDAEPGSAASSRSRASGSDSPEGDHPFGLGRTSRSGERPPSAAAAGNPPPTSTPQPAPATSVSVRQWTGSDFEPAGRRFEVNGSEVSIVPRVMPPGEMGSPEDVHDPFGSAGDAGAIPTAGSTSDTTPAATGGALPSDSASQGGADPFGQEDESSRASYAVVHAGRDLTSHSTSDGIDGRDDSTVSSSGTAQARGSASRWDEPPFGTSCSPYADAAHSGHISEDTSRSTVVPEPEDDPASTTASASQRGSARPFDDSSSLEASGQVEPPAASRSHPTTDTSAGSSETLSGTASPEDNSVPFGPGDTDDCGEPSSSGLVETFARASAVLQEQTSTSTATASDSREVLDDPPTSSSSGASSLLPLDRPSAGLELGMETLGACAWEEEYSLAQVPDGPHDPASESREDERPFGEGGIGTCQADSSQPLRSATSGAQATSSTQPTATSPYEVESRTTTGDGTSVSGSQGDDPPPFEPSELAAIGTARPIAPSTSCTDPGPPTSGTEPRNDVRGGASASAGGERPFTPSGPVAEDMRRPFGRSSMSRPPGTAGLLPTRSRSCTDVPPHVLPTADTGTVSVSNDAVEASGPERYVDFESSGGDRVPFPRTDTESSPVEAPPTTTGDGSESIIRRDVLASVGLEGRMTNQIPDSESAGDRRPFVSRPSREEALEEETTTPSTNGTGRRGRAWVPGTGLSSSPSYMPPSGLSRAPSASAARADRGRFFMPEPGEHQIIFLPWSYNTRSVVKGFELSFHPRAGDGRSKAIQARGLRIVRGDATINLDNATRTRQYGDHWRMTVSHAQLQSGRHERTDDHEQCSAR